MQSLFEYLSAANCQEETDAETGQPGSSTTAQTDTTQRDQQRLRTSEDPNHHSAQAHKASKEGREGRKKDRRKWMGEHKTRHTIHTHR
jgi:hypothetical protein